MKPSRKASEAEGRDSLAALAKLAAESYAELDLQLRERIARLEHGASLLEAALESIPQGICLFDAGERLVFSNRSFADIYGIEAAAPLAGLTLGELVARRSAADTLPTTEEEYLARIRSCFETDQGDTWLEELPDGRCVRVRHCPVAGGGWVSTHEVPAREGAQWPAGDDRLSLQALIDTVPDYLWVKDAESRFFVANRALAADCGRKRTADMIGLSDFDLHAPDRAAKFMAAERAILETGDPMIDKEEFVIDASGAPKWFLSSKIPLRDDNGETVGLIGISRDITARKKADTLRDGQAQILEMIARNAPLEEVLSCLVLLVESQLDGISGSILLVDRDGEHLRHGAAPNLPPDYTKAIDGIRIGPEVGSCGTAVYRREPVVVSDIASDPLWENYRHLALEQGYRSCWSTPVMSHQGAVIGVFAMYSRSVREPTGTESELIEFTTRIAGIAIERKLAEDQIHFMANHDALTGLPNRALLEDRLSQAILYARRYGRWVTVVFIDLDNFKRINDTLGHRAGDELLKTVAGRMSACVRAPDTVVRLGGDEFVIVLFDQPPSPEHASELVVRIQKAISEPLTIEGHRVTVTASMGVAHYPDDGLTQETLLANADAAMYQAKELGRDNCQLYVPELNARTHEKFILQGELRDAVERSEFVLLYQPQVNIEARRIFAVEALIRWNHPTRGLVMPGKFIPVAEETGLIVQIGDWVLREACRQNKAWQNAGLAPVIMCVNVSARQFKERNLVARVREALATTGLEPRFLELEVTESLIMQDVQLAVETMNELQQLGVNIAIDDFGTGYSSLSALKMFPIARLKIDKSFINDLAADANDQAVANAVISLGQKLNLRVIAEGVETDAQVRFLRDNNCREMQGYHFSRPVEPAEIERLIGGGEGGGSFAAWARLQSSAAEA